MQKSDLLHKSFGEKTYVEMPGIEPGAFHMQSERSTAELHPHHVDEPAQTASKLAMSLKISINAPIIDGIVSIRLSNANHMR